MATPPVATLPLPSLDDGERAALALAVSLHTELLLIDDPAAAGAALAHGFETVGTLGILDHVAGRGLVDLAVAFARLSTTNFRYRRELLDELLARHQADRGET
jgi:predicted nucleic acid-binding protein